jgi:hypothetical protein
MGYKPGQSFADYLAEQQAAFQPVRIPGAEGGFDTQFDPRAAYYSKNRWRSCDAAISQQQSCVRSSEPTGARCCGSDQRHLT